MSGRTGNAPTNASVTVAIVHTYQGDLKVDLVAPGGSLYNLHNRTGVSADNINKTVTFNLSSEALNGTWKLRVIDNAAGDVGRIDSWSITFRLVSNDGRLQSFRSDPGLWPGSFFSRRAVVVGAT